MTQTYKGFYKNKLKDLPMKINNLSIFNRTNKKRKYMFEIRKENLMSFLLTTVCQKKNQFNNQRILVDFKRSFYCEELLDLYSFIFAFI